MQFMNRLCAGLALLSAAAMTLPLQTAQAEWVSEGQANEGKFTVGMRAGFGFPTQTVIDYGLASSSSGVGPALNIDAMYGINKMVRMGLMFEYQNYSLSSDDDNPLILPPGNSIGTLHTVSLLPTIEIRPGQFGKMIPYASAGLGVNVNSFSEDDNLGPNRLSPDNTLALRLAGGMDFPITQNLALNTELAWKRNHGSYELNGVNGGTFDASALNFLVGVRMTF